MAGGLPTNGGAGFGTAVIVAGDTAGIGIIAVIAGDSPGIAAGIVVGSGTGTALAGGLVSCHIAGIVIVILVSGTCRGHTHESRQHTYYNKLFTIKSHFHNNSS